MSDQSVAQPMNQTICWRAPILLTTAAVVLVVKEPAGAKEATSVAMVALVIVAG